jgi:hypothetical protein
VIQFSDQSQLALDEHALVAIGSMEKNVLRTTYSNSVSMIEGDVLVHIASLNKQKQFKVNLPDIAAKLTGVEGEKVELGEHKNALAENTHESVQQEIRRLAEQRDAGAISATTFLARRSELMDNPNLLKKSPRSNLIFRNPDGTPKATATGKIYNIDGDVVRNVRYSKLTPLLDSNGEITSATIRETYNRNLELDRDPELAMARTDAQIRGALKGKMKDTNPKLFVQDGLGVASRAFDELGIDPGAKETFLGVTHRLLENLNLSKTQRIKSTDDLVASGQITQAEADGAYGAFMTGTTDIGLRPASVANSPDIGAFHFIKTLGHESYHSLRQLAADNASLGIDSNRLAQVRALEDDVKTLDLPTREQNLRDLQRSVFPDAVRKANPQLDRTLANTARDASKTVDEYMAETAGLLSTALAMKDQNVRLVQEHLRWAPQVLQDFAHALFRTIDDLKNIVLSTADFLGLSDGKSQQLNLFKKNLEMFLKPDVETEAARQTVANAMQPFRVVNGEVGLQDVKWSKTGSAGLDEDVGKIRKTNNFERNWLNMQQAVDSQRVKHNIPVAPRVMQLLTTLGGKINTRAQAIRSEFMVTADNGLLTELSQVSDKKLTPEQIKLKSNVGMVESSLELRTGLSKIYTRMNTLLAETNDAINFDHPKFV